MPKIICVYKITSPSGRVYIGSTVDFNKRMSDYKKLDCKQQPKLYASLCKYGFDDHLKEIIEICTLANFRQQEGYYGNLYNCLDRKTGLNHSIPKLGEGYKSRSDEMNKKIGLTKIGNKNTLGFKHPPSSRLLMSQWQKGKNKPLHKMSTRKLMSEKAMGGKNHKAKILLNLNNGIFYDCFQDAAKSINVNYNTFRSRKQYKKRWGFIIV